MGRDTRRRSRMEEDDERDEDEENDPRETEPDGEEDDEEDDAGDDMGEVPPDPRMMRGKMEKGVTASSFIDQLEDYTDSRLPVAVRRGIRELLPRHNARIEKSVKGSSNRTEVRVQDLVKSLSYELGEAFTEAFVEGVAPIITRLKRIEEGQGEFVKAVLDNTEALEDVFTGQEELRKSITEVPEQDRLLKAMEAEHSNRAQTTPATQNTRSENSNAEALEKSIPSIPGEAADAARGGMPTSEVERFQKLLGRAEKIQTEHFETVPAYAQAMGAYSSGRINAGIIEELEKSVVSTEKGLRIKSL